MPGEGAGRSDGVRGSSRSSARAHAGGLLPVFERDDEARPLGKDMARVAGEGLVDAARQYSRPMSAGWVVSGITSSEWGEVPVSAVLNAHARYARRRTKGQGSRRGETGDGWCGGGRAPPSAASPRLTGHGADAEAPVVRDAPSARQTSCPLFLLSTARATNHPILSSSHHALSGIYQRQ